MASFSKICIQVFLDQLPSSPSATPVTHGVTGVNSGEAFRVIDLLYAYNQWLLDEEPKHALSNAFTDLYCFILLSFGISFEQTMYQGCMEGVLSIVPGVLVYPDVTIVVEKAGRHFVGCAAAAEEAQPVA
ncbi:hypothetical protein MTO96_002800 [Rhipicephalus appendiculatus]